VLRSVTWHGPRRASHDPRKPCASGHCILSLYNGSLKGEYSFFLPLSDATECAERRYVRAAPFVPSEALWRLVSVADFGDLTSSNSANMLLDPPI